MDYEKKYFDAIERLKQWDKEHQNGYVVSDRDKFIFPELAESEDEKMRRQTLKVLNYYKDEEKSEGRMPTEIDECIVWLEKQGKNNMGISEATKKKLEDNLNKALEKETPESCNEFLDEQGEYNTVVVIPKFRVGDVIRPKGSTTEYTIESISGECYHGKGWGLHISCDDDYELVEQKPSWSEEDEAIYYGVIETEQYMLDVVNGIKKFNVGNISIKEECTRELNWLKSLKDKCLPQPKQEWSEEDIVAIDCAVEVLNKDLPSLAASIERLKSLSPQKHWKPSDEQIEALDFAADCIVLAEFCVKRKVLKELLEQLKKLREK